MLGVYYIRYQLPSNSNKQMLQQAKLLVARWDTLAVAFAFLLQNFGNGGRDLWMIFCLSMSVGSSKIGTLTGGWDFQTLTAKIKFVWTFCSQRWWGDENIALAPFYAPAT